MGVFGFVQRKMEEKILGDIFQELLLSRGLLLHYKSFECHGKSGLTHKAIGALMETGKGVYFHFCDSEGYATFFVEGEKPTWLAVPWLTPNVKQSAAAMFEFLVTVKGDFD